MFAAVTMRPTVATNAKAGHCRIDNRLRMIGVAMNVLNTTKGAAITGYA